ncbi:FHA domain-containing protein [Candidatus Spongiihabitans sp.]|uniref:FHA domain-containing protein n=1 Tax=Candidatus Spongiihabitans sp. TaxID=3101308 RepID=UPI003C7E1933
MNEPIVVTVGRAESCLVRVSNSTVSRLHCTITLYSRDQMFVSDDNSANGTKIRVDGQWQPVHGPHPITPKTMMMLGEYVVVVHQLLAGSTEAMAVLSQVSPPPQNQTADPINSSATVKRDPITGEIIKK